MSIETTRPKTFLYIDLQKSISWKEELHKRNPDGKFTTIRSGSPVVTDKGKTGVVEKVTGDHYHIRHADGKKSKLSKEKVIHATDHKKAMDAKKKTKKRKASAVKGQATKTSNKANGLGKAEVLATPKVKMASGKKQLNSKVKTMEKKATAENKAIRSAKKERNLSAPDILRKQVGAGKAEATNDQSADANYYANMEGDRDTTKDIDNMWKDKAVQKLMSLAPEKRSEADIRRLSGSITTNNDKLARHATLQMGKARGLNLLHQVNRIGDVGQSGNGEVINQETGYYGDILQSARASMYETLYRVMKGSQNPGEGASVGMHVVTRMRQKLHSDIYALMNEVPAPHEIRSAIGDMSRGEKELTQKLGRNATHDELASHLEKNSKHFKEAPIMDAPNYDEKSGQWVAGKKRISDPSERLRMLKTYASQQKASSLDLNVGSEGENEVTRGGNLKDTSATPDELYEQKERQKELKGAIPKALSDMGLDDNERRVFMTMYGSPSSKINRGNMTMPEVAEAINADGGIGGKDVDEKVVYNLVRSAMKKIQQARDSDHPALKQLSLLKSLFFSIMMKSMYEYDLVKSLSGWGVGIDTLKKKFTRTTEGDSLLTLRKSIAPYEYIGSIVTTDDGKVQARLIEFVLPEDNELYKSFNAYASGVKKNLLKKSFFPHKGKSHEVNKKASDYVKANKGKYKVSSEAQHKSAQNSKGGTTWSEALLLKNPGSAWVSWGGKRILVNVDSGDILYDSSNSAHREEHNEGAQEDKIDFHHEKEALATHEDEREKSTHEEWKAQLAMKERNAKGGKTFDYGKEREAFAKKHKGASFDDDGNLSVKKDTEVDDSNAHTINDGIQAFKGQMKEMSDSWNNPKTGTKIMERSKNWHKALDVYSALTPSERERIDSLPDDKKQEFLGNHFLNKDGMVEAMKKYHDAFNKGEDASEASAELAKLLTEGGSNSVKNKSEYNSFLKAVQKYDPTKGDNMEELEKNLGQREMSLGKVKHNQKLMPEGKYTIANPITGKTMMIEIGGSFSGGRAGKGNKYTVEVKEAFDPEGRVNFDKDADGHISWGSIGKALGYTGKDADNLKERLTQDANKDETTPFMKPTDDAEYAKSRANTAVGMQETMAHKDFKLVDESRNKDKQVTSRTFAMDMPDGTQNTIRVDGKGNISDPVMARLLKQGKPIMTVADLHEVMQKAVGNRAWVTANAGSNIHIGDALGHHIQLEYDGKGAPRVVGGVYDGHRFMDSNDVPKGAVDPATGEPIKAMFKNGKLIDRKFTTKNKVAMEAGSKVLYKSDKGTFRKGKIHSIEGDNYKVTGADGHVVGMFKKSDLKQASEEGRTLSDSGQVAVRLAQNGTHRMNTEESFKADNPKDQKKVDKAKELFKVALQKAKINDAFDPEGNLKKNMELSDAMMKQLTKRLGGSKAGKELLKKFKSAYTAELEVHVPESERGKVSTYGVNIKKDGTARISAGKFEELREAMGGLSIDHKARTHLEEHFNRKDRKPKTIAQLQKGYQPSQVDPNSAFGQAYQAQFKPDSFVMNKDTGLYSTQLEGVAHLIERKRGIVGHGMGVGKTIEGVVASLHVKAQKIANGEKPKKTLIVCPAGIQSDWGKEIAKHTNSKALYIGSESKLRKRDANGNWMKGENNRHMFGQDGTEQEAMTAKKFLGSMDSVGAEDHDFHIMSYEQFMNHRDELADSGLYGNIIVDEIHAFKNKTGKRGKSLSETTNKFENVWGLSGTPVENDAREIHSLIDTVTGGKHELGSAKEFADNYLMKDKRGKITGVKPSMAGKLGDILANVVQFRSGKDVQYASGAKIHFPQLVGMQTNADPNPQGDFMGNMVDRNRDHQTTEYYGTKHSVFDYTNGSHDVAGKDGESYNVNTTQPANLTPKQQKFYDDYNAVQAKYLPEAKLKEMAKASQTGFDTEKGAKSEKGESKNYLTAMQKLQKFLNAPNASKMYVPDGGNALDSDSTGAQAVPGAGKKKKTTGFKPYNPVTGEGHYKVDSEGNKRYFESDGKGSYARNADGTPKLLPPMHHDNPKAEYLKQRVGTYLDNLQQENAQRVKDGKPELMPKVVVKSSYTTFGTDIVDGVMRDLQNEHPHLAYWADKLQKEGKTLGAGQFTGEAEDRESTKTEFRGNKNAYDKDQGSLWATSVSPAGKEGVDFGNAHLMLMYDQDWNPEKMAQFTARVRRSDSHESHSQVGRSNSVRVESLHMPGTVEDFMFNAEDSKAKNTEKLKESTRQAEQSTKFGDSEAKSGRSKNFTRNGKNRAGAKIGKAKTVSNQTSTERPTMGKVSKKAKEALVAKSLKLIVRL